jgi:DNA-binding NarL/FixJ family response regulator
MPRLIIADDNPRDRGFLLEVLARYTPTVAANGQEALNACANELEPWLVTDIQMPGLNGVELARHIWARQPAARLLFCSQHSDETYVRALSKTVPPETVYGYVLKNNSAETVARAAQAVFEEDQCWIDPQVRRVQARTLRAHDALTDAEYEVMIDIALGLTDNSIAERRYLSRRGVQNRLHTLYAKLGAHEETSGKRAGGEVLNVRTRAVAIALQRGLINAFELERELRLLDVWLTKI